MLMISFGTRPEYIKIKPLLDTFKGKIPFKLLFTGQHVDLVSNLSDHDVVCLKIEDGPNRLDSIVQSIMNQDEIFEGIDSVLIQGDTTSAFGVALAAFHRRLKVVHLEAGLRTYDNDNPFPEEFNRQAISRMASINLCPTEEAAECLRQERAIGSVHVVGNTVLDNLVGIPQTRTNKVVITMHRRENHDKIPQWFSMFDKLAKDNPELEFILPIHPNPKVKMHRDILQHVNVVDPMDHASFINLLASSFMVITDSGGLQEESSFVGKKCIVCREVTERAEGIGTFAFTCSPDLEQLEGLFYAIKNNPYPPVACPYGDGYSSQRICKILMREL